MLSFLHFNSFPFSRLIKMSSSKNAQLLAVECTIMKDVVRTDRRNPFFVGDCNPNLDIMR